MAHQYNITTYYSATWYLAGAAAYECLGQLGVLVASDEQPGCYMQILRVLWKAPWRSASQELRARLSSPTEPAAPLWMWSITWNGIAYVYQLMEATWEEEKISRLFLQICPVILTVKWPLLAPESPAIHHAVFDFGLEGPPSDLRDEDVPEGDQFLVDDRELEENFDDSKYDEEVEDNEGEEGKFEGDDIGGG
ncbi:hypothetical protein BT96DRAFT_950014 [Gymnopus androsaceus JB14]|uniref:Uncharacterized protein n=1 Tax=Gymnopus androsaceus JB14 TaxID=1447944 RepID=A0A6A4GIS0_9AGAR|nr:hypothetical protein BT96DRAFT_950014 [Gymnopus androsaceus JB14]